MSSYNMKRLLLDWSFEDIISEAEEKTLVELKLNINNTDMETTKKLELLGINEISSKHEIEKLVHQCQRPHFSSLVKIFEKGMFDFDVKISTINK